MTHIIIRRDIMNLCPKCGIGHLISKRIGNNVDPVAFEPLKCLKSIVIGAYTLLGETNDLLEPTLLQKKKMRQL